MRHRTFWRRALVLAYIATVIAMGASFSTQDAANRQRIKMQQINDSRQEAACLEITKPEQVDPVPTPVPVGYVTPDTDLKSRTNITVQQMNQLINAFTRYYPDSAFKGMGQAFITASEETGYDPIFLFSLAGLESGWSVSYIHGYLNNPYSIGMIDSNIWNGWSFDTFEDGIISGAHAIYDIWYANGKTTLNQMQERPTCYATDELWASKVAEIMAECYDILQF